MTRFGPIALVLVLVACVEVDKIEVNLHFHDALQREMEKREGEIIEAGTAKDGSRAFPRASDVFPAASAQDEDLALEMNTPAINEIYKRRKERAAKLAEHFTAGRLGDGNDGSVAIRSEEGLTLEQKQALRKLTGEENDDRRKLWGEIVKANEGAQVKPEDVKRLWIGARRKMAPKGHWLQNDKGKWKQKSTDKGKDDPKLEKDE